MGLSFNNTGIGVGLRRRIEDQWPNPDERHEILTANPYALMRVDGISFTLADRCAVKWGFINPTERTKAAILHILDQAHRGSGHTYFPTMMLTDKIARLGVVVTKSDLLDVIREGAKDGSWTLGNSTIALPEFARYECEIAAYMRDRLKTSMAPVEPIVEGLMEDQVAAVTEAVKAAVFIFYGSPGTGKSFTIKRLIDSFKSANLSVSLAAPTGKAAKRMEELSGTPAQTIHRLLGPKPYIVDGRKTWHFEHGLNNPIGADVVILDECSMIDVWLMWRFLQALKPDTRLIMVGDPYQLPSVGAGNVLGDLIESRRVPMAELTILKRQDPTKMIAANCSTIKQGEMVRIDNEQFVDFFFVPTEGEVDALDTVVRLASHIMPARYKCEAEDIQVITALRERGLLSVKELNGKLRTKLNPGTEGMRFAVNDRVICTRNNYDLGIMNGDIGLVHHVLEGRRGVREVTVRFETPVRTVRIPTHRLIDLEFAWAQTVHKMQGSEAKYVVIPIHPTMGTFIVNRSWLYTAVSRAKEAVYLVGSRIALWGAIQRMNSQTRYTRLKELMET